MRNVISIALNSIKISLRRKGVILAILALPILALLLSIFIYKGDDTPAIRVGLVNYESTNITKDFERFLAKEGSFKVVVIKSEDINNQLTKNKVDCVVVIPKGFTSSLLQQKPKPIEFIAIKGKEATLWLNKSTNAYFSNVLKFMSAAQGNQQEFKKIYDAYQADKMGLEVMKQDEQKDRKVTRLGIGFLVFFIMMAGILNALYYLIEKQQGTYSRVVSTPVSPVVYQLGQGLANFFIISFQIFFVLIILTLVFRLETYIPFYQLFLILVVFGLFTISLGVLITSWAKDLIEAALSILLILPVGFLGGCFFPVENMSSGMQKIAYFIPPYWTMDAIEVLQRGQGLGAISLNLIITMAFTITFFIIAIYNFKTIDRFEKQVSNYFSKLGR